TASLTIHYRSVGHTSGSPPANQTLATPGSIRLSGQGSLVRPGFALIGWRRTNGTVYQLNSVASWSTQTTGIAAFDAVWVPIVTMRYNVFANPSTTVAAGQGFVDTVKPYFMSNFGIDLVQNSAGLVTTQLNQRSGCESDDRCSPACGDEADGADCWQRHHRASRHFLNVSRSNGVVSNFRFVDYRLCFFGMRADGTLGHMMVGGLAYLGRHDMIVTTASLLDARHITAHEISHLFNAQDNECTPGQQCVMRTVFFTYNQWCDTCRQSIMTFRGQ
ncbi:MAG: hypothetical protein FWD03_00945, partial [Defluviitaleaceae bacterium]|nr:hypothetical protein [Defluviitaleaceae bacterium]